MKLGLNIGYSGSTIDGVLPLVEHADRIGIDSVWAAEAYGSDAVTVLSYLAARTERIKLGSGDPADAGAHAREHRDDGDDPRRAVRRAAASSAWGCPARRSSRAGTACRTASRWAAPASTSRSCARPSPARHRWSSTASTIRSPTAARTPPGLGKPLKSILHPVRDRIPIYLAAIGPKNVALTAEIADGWLPIFYSPEREDIFNEHLDAGLAERRPRAPTSFEIAASVMVAAGDDVGGLPRPAAAVPRAVHRRHGRARAATSTSTSPRATGSARPPTTIQDLYLDGRKDEAAAAVPDELVDEVALVGPLDRIVDRLAAWKESRVGTMILGTYQPEVLTALQEAL